MHEVWQSLPASRILEDALEGTCLLESRLCEQCGKTFSCQAYFQTHLKMHSGAKPHTCAQRGGGEGLGLFGTPPHPREDAPWGEPWNVSSVGKPRLLSLPFVSMSGRTAERSLPSVCAQDVAQGALALSVRQVWESASFFPVPSCTRENTHWGKTL